MIKNIDHTTWRDFMITMATFIGQVGSAVVLPSSGAARRRELAATMDELRVDGRVVEAGDRPVVIDGRLDGLVLVEVGHRALRPAGVLSSLKIGGFQCRHT